MQGPTDEAEIRQRVDKWAAAIRAADLDGVMSSYAPDVVSFDVGPELRQAGADSKRKNWAQVFTVFQPPLGYEVRDLTISVSGDLAFVHSLNRLTANSKDGRTTGMWVRFTACFRKINGEWQIVVDHVSAPVDPASGRALMNSNDDIETRMAGRGEAQSVSR